MLVVLSPGVGRVIPRWVLWENGPVEWGQVGVLVLCLLVSVAWVRRSRDRLESRFWWWAVLVESLLVGRELNWGRVFYVVSYNLDGPVLIPIPDFPLAQFLETAVLVVVIIAFVAFLALRLYRVPLALIHQHRFPWVEAGTVLLAAVIAYVGDTFVHALPSEEVAEACMYLAVLLAVLRMKPSGSPAPSALAGPASTTPPR